MNNHYWDSAASSYLSVWSKFGHRRVLHEQENTFITSSIQTYLHTSSKSKKRYIDLGCGPGRIIEIIKRVDPNYGQIIGIDGSQEMIALASKRFCNESNILLCNEPIPLRKEKRLPKAHIITMIRVLKYLHEREAIFSDVRSMLHTNGIFIFTVTNRNSIAYFDMLRVHHYKDSLSEIEALLHKQKITILEVTGFQKLPEFLYLLAAALHMTRIILALEHLLQRLCGPTFLARTLYIVAQRQA